MGVTGIREILMYLALIDEVQIDEFNTYRKIGLRLISYRLPRLLRSLTTPHALASPDEVLSGNRLDTNVTSWQWSQIDLTRTHRMDSG